MVHSDAERGADGVLTAVALAYAVLLVILAVEVKLELVDDISRYLRQSSSFSSQYEAESTARNILSSPIEVSTTYGV